MSEERETWDIARDAAAILNDARARLTDLAESMSPITGDGYGHMYIDNEAVTLKERLLFAGRIVGDMGEAMS